MQFQTLSVVVPTGRCVNACPFCVSKMHVSPYEKIMENQEQKEAYFEQYRKRLQFAQDNGSNTLVFTGTAEPLQNKPFMKKVSEINNSIRKPFLWMEVQTTGVYLLHPYNDPLEEINQLRSKIVGKDDIRCLRKHETQIDFLKDAIGISTIALSVVDPFNDENNMDTMNVLPKLRFSLDVLTKTIKDKGLNLRLCFNLTKKLERKQRNFYALIDRAKDLGADQLTLRQMYSSGKATTSEDLWVNENSFKISMDEIRFSDNRELESLPTGAKRYSVNGVSVVYDDDCMSYETKEVVRYLILQSNAKLYTKWDDPASLVF